MAKRLMRATSIFSGMTFISRIMGFLRDMVVAHVFGATGTTDAFYVAFKIPNFMRRLFAEGSFSQAFVPVLSEYKSQKTAEELKQFVDHTSGTLGAILFSVTVLAVIFAPILIMIFSPGFPQTGDRFELASYMLRITFPYLFFISLTAFAGSILNTHGYFAGPAFTPVLLNLVMIFFTLVISPHFAQPIVGLAWGVFAAGLVQLLFQYPFLKRINLVPRLKWGWRDPGVRRILRLMLPAIFGVSVIQIGVLIDTIFASFLQAGSITWLYNAERLMAFPLGGFAVAISTVVLPDLSKKFTAGSHEEYSRTMNWAIQMVLLIGIPAGIGLIMLAQPLLTTMFNYGKFTQYDVVMSSYALIAYSVGVPFMMVLKVLASGFYARQDIKTPVKIGVIALLVNVAFNFILFKPLQHAGLALSSSIAALVNSGLICILLLKRNIFKVDKSWWLFLLRMLIVNAVLIIFIYYFNHPQSEWFAWTWPIRFLHLGILVVGASVIYMGLLRLMGFKFWYNETPSSRT